MGGLIQSGQEVEGIWKAGLDALGDNPLEINNCLILGLGAGNSAKLVSERYPKVKITGVEIDPEVVELGKRYFGLGRINNLEIRIEDAINFIIRSLSTDNHYDLILIDLYLGNESPKEGETEQFLRSLQKQLSPKGWVIFNRLYYTESAKRNAEIFNRTLQRVFDHVKAVRVNWNRLYLCRH